VADADRQVLVKFHDISLHLEPSAAGHGIARIDGQVHDDLVELAGVGLDNRRLRSGHDPNFDVVAHERAQQFADVLEPVVQIENDRLDHLLAAESQQLASKCGAAFGRFSDVFHVDRRLRGGIDAVAQEFRARVDNAQNVVKIVSHAAGQPADRLHFLGLAQLILGPTLRCDVTRDRGGANDLAVDIAQRRNADRNIQSAPVFGQAQRFVVFDAHAARNLSQDFRDLMRTIIRHQHGNVLADHLFRRISVDAFRPAVPGGNRAIETLGQNGIFRGVNNRGQPRPVFADLLGRSLRKLGMGFAQFLLDSLTVTDVADGAQHHRAALDKNRAETDFDRKFRAVTPPSVEIETLPHPSNPGRGGEALTVIVMPIAEALGNQHLDFLAHQLTAGEAE